MTACRKCGHEHDPFARCTQRRITTMDRVLAAAANLDELLSTDTEETIAALTEELEKRDEHAATS